MIYILFSIILLLSTVTSAIDIPCSYSKGSKNITDIKGPEKFECSVLDKFEVKTRGVAVYNIKNTNSTQTHRPNSIEDVIALKIGFKLLNFIPSGIGRLLPKLLKLKVTNCELKEVMQVDLMQFPHLRILELSTNDIEVIGKDLFKFNPSLELIDLNYNNIKEIAGNVFDDLKHLKYLRLTGNLCTQLSSENIQKIIKNVKEMCSGTAHKSQKDDDNEPKKHKKLDVSHGTKFWIFVGFGVVSGFIVAGGLILIVYRIIKPSI
ncbi:unnamed protein product [Chironomus riparius]|uniref:Uncharacterized protein n=1 Tax=Chironomus riparius TaxID=315576 RepID=A0A9N9WY86_9DIPT|nr:unnamed protein product [Chironomus riparius]